MFRSLETNLAQFVAQAVPKIGAESIRIEPVAVALDGTHTKLGRNDIVTITNGTETKEMKFKKAEGLLKQGWRIVSS